MPGSMNSREERVEKASGVLFDYIKPKLEDDAKARVENAFYDLSIDKYDCGLTPNNRCGVIGGPIARGLYHLLTLRPDLLTLLLVVLMGVLGSALQITHAYFMRNQAPSIGQYFQRITVGAVTALAIFIVAKAGVPIIADASRLGGDASINPYFVSFLGDHFRAAVGKRHLQHSSPGSEVVRTGKRRAGPMGAQRFDRRNAGAEPADQDACGPPRSEGAKSDRQTQGRGRDHPRRAENNRRLSPARAARSFHGYRARGEAGVGVRHYCVSAGSAELKYTSTCPPTKSGP
jgi:hypothetical protein